MGVSLLIGIVHVALVARLYHVGSFDDDAGYILSAKALLAGHGLGAQLPMGERVVGLYPPGYSALIAPLLWVLPHTYVPIRILSGAFYAAAFPLLWWYLGRRDFGYWKRTAALLVLALGPPFATYGSMVMAESSFIVVLLILLLAVDYWSEDPRLLSLPALTTVVSAAVLVWLKQAGIGLVAGLVLWLLLAGGRSRLARAALVAGGLALSLVPVVLARLDHGIPLAGSRYSFELGVYYQGGLLARLRDVLPASGWHLLSTAIPATIVPYLAPLPISGHWPDLWKILSWHVTLLVLVGVVAWARRFRDAAGLMAGVYLFESILWPFVNERRAILVLPLLVGWYVLGASVVWRALTARWRFRVPAILPAGIVVVALVIGPLIAQLPRDYLYGWNQPSSQPAGSRYAGLLRRLPAGVVETDYRATVALFTGKQTNWSAFTTTQYGNCTAGVVSRELSQDAASYLLLGDLNKPGLVDSPCLLGQVRGAGWAVPLLHSARDDATVYELVGPGTGHPDLVDLLGGLAPQATTDGMVSTETWPLGPGARVQQLSVGSAGLQVGEVASVSLELDEPQGWRRLAFSAGPVGDPPAATPYLLADLPAPQAATAVRLVITGAGRAGPAWFQNVRAFGSRPGNATR